MILPLHLPIILLMPIPALFRGCLCTFTLDDLVTRPGPSFPVLPCSDQYLTCNDSRNRVPGLIFCTNTKSLVGSLARDRFPFSCESPILRPIA
jgi:hypothetical protein